MSAAVYLVTVSILIIFFLVLAVDKLLHLRKQNRLNYSEKKTTKYPFNKSFIFIHNIQIYLIQMQKLQIYQSPVTNRQPQLREQHQEATGR